MATAIVVLVSLLVGAATYIATVRGGHRTPAAVGFDGSSTAAMPADPPASPERTDDEEVEGDPHDGVAEVVALDTARDRVAPDAPPEAGEDASARKANAEVDAETDIDEDVEPAMPEVHDADPTAVAEPLAPVIIDAPPTSPPEPGYSYLRVATAGPSWRDRIAGVLGLAVMLVIGAGAVAFAIYQLGSAINAVIQRFLEG